MVADPSSTQALVSLVALSILSDLLLLNVNPNKHPGIDMDWMESFPHISHS